MTIEPTIIFDPPAAGTASAFLPSSAPRRPWRLAPRTLTSRLVGGVVMLVVLVVLATAVGTYVALGSFLGKRLDQQLQSTANGSLRSLFSGPDDHGPGVRGPQFVWAVALDAQGNVLADPATSSVEAMQLSAGDRAALAARVSPRPVTIDTTGGQELRVTIRPAVVVSGGGSTPGIAVIGLSTDEENRTLARLVKLELLIGGVATLLALFATFYGVRFSLRRLRRVTSTAQEVAAELSPSGAGLDRRVDVPDDGSEVGQLAESMNTLLSAVETQFAARVESEDRMRRFLADASHELRTPLTSIRGYAELARMQRALGRVDEDNLGRIEAEGVRMSRLVEDLLLLARGDQGGAPQRELIDIAELVDDAASSARAAFPDRQIQVDDTPGYHVVGDRDQLVRAVRNLITNAAVHTPPTSPIRVRGFASGAGVAIQVVDGGPGLPAEEAAHVFERFWRADKARTRARGGSGLGLSIVASIAQAHGGSVRFDSSVEAGSTVTVWLPAATAY